MQIDILKTPFDNLLAIVNATNATALTAAQLTMGDPTVVGPEAADDNTTVTLTAVVGQGYTGTVDVTYRRLLLNMGVVAPASSFPTDGASTLATVKTAIATALNLLESEFDLTGTLPASFGDVTIGTLTAVATSLLYVGTIDVTLEWTDTLDSAITVTNLSGFDPAA